MTHSQESLSLAANLFRTGRFAEAGRICESILTADPSNAETWHLLALVAWQGSDIERAIECSERSLELAPAIPDEHCNLGYQLITRGLIEAAARVFQRVTDLAPSHAPAHDGLAATLKRQGRLAEAIASYRRALEIDPNSPETLTNLGLALIGIDNARAVACCRRAAEIGPGFPQVHSNLGLALVENDQHEEAISSCRRALELSSTFPEAHTNLGVACLGLGMLADAEEALRRALLLNPNQVAALCNLGTVMASKGSFDEAERLGQQALSIDRHSPQANLLIAMLMLLRGDLERAWAGLEMRWKTGEVSARQFTQPLWNGEPLSNKTILLWADHALGDTIQFVRFAATVKRLGGTVIIECQEPLAKLLASLQSADRILTQGEELPAFDVHLPLLSLPRILNTALHTIPADVPYLFARPALTELWKARLCHLDGFRIGINWKGQSKKWPYSARTIPLEMFQSLAEIPGVTLVSLQKDADPSLAMGASKTLGEADATNPQPLDPSPSPIVDLGEFDTTHGAFMDTAAIMMNLDLVITSDTSIAHLAGALGVPVWIALPFAPDWRWLLDRSDSPWYPTMRLFRQKSPGDWAGVFTAIKSALVERLNSDDSWRERNIALGNSPSPPAREPT